VPLVCVAFDDIIEAANLQVPDTLTGKTSLGQQNSHALGRPFHHIALGGSVLRIRFVVIAGYMMLPVDLVYSHKH
jgi:hypothetical protein